VQKLFPGASPAISYRRMTRSAFLNFESYGASFLGRREVANPESITTGRRCGFRVRGLQPAPRNDRAAHMIGFMESIH